MKLPLEQIVWKRMRQPILSSMTTSQRWAGVSMRSPSVIRHDDRYRMWYIATNTRSRGPDGALGYAESTDGLVWREYPGNPVVTPGDLPFGAGLSTPYVMFDDADNLLKMWFTAVDMKSFGESGACGIRQRLAYACSRDGLSWDFHDKPLFPSLRAPCVIRLNEGYLMWAGSDPFCKDDFDALVSNIYRFTSRDGIRWERDRTPAVSASGRAKSVVYPSVSQHHCGWNMIYGSHVDGGFFEMYHATSPDGIRWTPHHDASFFPATRRSLDFDGRYTSMPCLVNGESQYLLYYAARDMGCLYGGDDGLLHADASGIYRHIGVATGTPT